MNHSQQATLLTQQLEALNAQADTARLAHSAIAEAARIPNSDELSTITDTLTQLVNLALEPTSAQSNGAKRTVHSYHAELDQLLQRSARLMQENRELVERALRSTARQGSTTSGGTDSEQVSYCLYAHLSVLEAYLASVRGLAYQALSFVSGNR